MKQLIFFLFLPGWLVAVSQPVSQAPSHAASQKMADSTAIGEPIGEKYAKTIGPGGGKIGSPDSAMELVFPPGALAAPTEIRVQRVSNTCASGLGNAYAFEPDGIRFQKPVHLLIHYADSSRRGTPALSHIIRWQDSKGIWSTLAATELDTAAHTIGGQLAHFSTYSVAANFAIVYPGPAQVGERRMFQFRGSGLFPDGNMVADNDLNALGRYFQTHPIIWSVNGHPGGDAINGTISPQSATCGVCALYNAPASLPPSNVEITAECAGEWRLSPTVSVTNLKVSLWVIIFDLYHYSFTEYDQIGTLHMIDSAMCDIRVESSGAIRLSNIENPVPWSDWPERPNHDKCRYEYPDKNGWKGMAQIESMAGAEFDIGSTRGAPMVSVTIRLGAAMGSTPAAIVHCPKSTRRVPSRPMSASPFFIEFDTRPDGGVLLKYGGKTGVNIIDNVNNEQGYVIRMNRITQPRQ